MTYFGIAETSGRLVTPLFFDGTGRPVYVRSQPRNFLIVVEAAAGPNGFAPGREVFRSVAGDPGARPDLQIQSTRPLGNGSLKVCDKDPVTSLGGVPGIEPPDFSPESQFVADALNDFACRFVPRTRGDEACTLNSLDVEAFVSPRSAVQFCFEPAVGAEAAFPRDDTVLTVRVRDVQGALGDPIQIVVRVP